MYRICFIFFYLLPLHIFCQTLEGFVFDENQKPIARASVYLDGTTIGTITDDKGFFSLSMNRKINTSLVVRFLGYEKAVVGNLFANSIINITLVPKLLQLNEVVIKKDYFTRKQKIQLFREQFLGTTKAGKSCKISNEKDIDFEYDYKSNTLTATSSNPLQIENLYLGYQIAFDLYEFKVKFATKSIQQVDVLTSLFLGTTLYNDVNNGSKIKKRRSSVYLGSSMHFFKNLSNNNWGQDSFLLFVQGLYKNPNRYFTISDEGKLKKILVKSNFKSNNQPGSPEPQFKASFDLLYKIKKQSNITFSTDVFYVDEYGNNSHVDKILFGGDIGTKKLGDLLPMNYKVDL